EAADLVEERAPEAQADAVDGRHLDNRRLHAGAALEAVDDGAPDVAAVAPHPSRAVESRQAHSPAVPPAVPPPVPKGRREPLGPRRLAHFGVVVDEAHGVRAGEPASLVERADQAHVRRVALVAEREWQREVTEIRLGAVRRAVVHYAELEGHGGR